jgi:PAS domain S-box-containing protein
MGTTDFGVTRLRNTGPTFRYAAAILAACLALIARGALAPLLGDPFAYHTLWLPVVFSAWYCGLGPSILAAVLSAVGNWYWFVPQYHSLVIQNRTDGFGILGYVIFSGAIIAIGETNRRGNEDRARIASIVESSGDAIVAVDRNGSITAWNRGAERLCGYSAPEAIGQTLPFLFADAHAELRSFIGRQMPSDAVTEVETTWLRKDGVRREISVNIFPFRDRAGLVVGSSIVARDITDRKQAEIDQRERERQLALATEAAELGIWHWYPDGDRATWDNARVYEVMGRSMDDGPVNGADFLSAIVHQDDKRAFEQAFAACMETGSRFLCQGRIRRNDGTWAWVEFTARPDYRPDGSLYCLFGTVRDITESTVADAALRQSEERLRISHRASHSGAWEVDLNTKQIIWSNELQLLWGLVPGSIAQDDVRGQIRRMILSEDHPAVDRALAECLESNDGEYHVEFRIARADGAIRWMESFAEVIYDEAGTARRIIGVTTDIDERKRSEQREREITAEAVAANAKFRAVFEQAPVLASMLTVSGIVVETNRLSLEMSGYRAEEILGKPFWEAGWFRGSTHTQSLLRSAVFEAAKGSTFREVLSYQWSDGSEHIAEFALNPIRDPHGEIIFLHPVAVDVTELKLAVEKYRRLAETLDAEVRSRTATLEQQSEELRSLSWRLLRTQDDERRHIARELHDSAGQTLTVLNMNLARIVDAARDRAPHLVEDAIETQQLVKDLNQEIRTTSYLLHPPLLDEVGLSDALGAYVQGLAARSGIAIELSVAPQFGRHSPDLELAIFRLIQECLTNIHRHSGSKTAEIRLSVGDDVISVEVQDHGKGIPPEKLADIHSESSGVGIRGMRERIRRFNGEVQIDSNASGTRIIVSIPSAFAGGAPLVNDVRVKA